MRLEELNLSFIQNPHLQKEIAQFVDNEQKKLCKKQSIDTMLNPHEEKVFSLNDELLKDTLFLKEENTEPTTITSSNEITEIEEQTVTPVDYIEYHEEEFNDNEEDWSVSNNNDYDYIKDYEERSFENHEDDIHSLLLISDIYTYPRDYEIYENCYRGFLYIKSISEKEFFLPCVLTENGTIKYIPEHKDKYNHFYDYIEMYNWNSLGSINNTQLFIFTDNSFFQHVFNTEDNIIFNNPEQIKQHLILKEEIEKDSNYFYLSNKYNETSLMIKSKKLKI